MCYLRVMNSYEFENYLKEAIVNYANNLMKSQGSVQKDCYKEAKQTIMTLLPNGVESKDQYLYHIINNTDALVGKIWLGLTNDKLGFIYDFSILEPFRGQGHGAKAMALIELKAKELGIKKLRLRVFGHNLAAISLYKKLGYQIDYMNMSKEV